ncbi:MAG: ammonium transporter, partial [Myxococcales bacterium]
WVAIEWLHRGNPTVLGAATACVAGLVAITPACAFVTPLGAIGIGIGVSVLCYAAVTFLKPMLGFDDSLDVFGVHGIGGTWGAIATGLFIADFARPEGISRGGQIAIQLQSVLVTAIFAPLATIAILLLLRAVMGDLRVGEEEEFAGLDRSEHRESAYVFGATSGTSPSHAPSSLGSAAVGHGEARESTA